MQVGSLVELVNDKWQPDTAEMIRFGFIFPVKNKPYTIREIEDDIQGVGVLLEEINNARLNRYIDTGNELLFNIARFRELMPPMSISVESILESEEQLCHNT